MTTATQQGNSYQFFQPLSPQARKEAGTRATKPRKKISLLDEKGAMGSLEDVKAYALKQLTPQDEEQDILQRKQAHTALTVDILVRLDMHFRGEEMRTTRKDAAEYLLRYYLHQNNEAIVNEENDVGDPLPDVLDFFDLIGLLTRKDELDMELIYTTFYPFVLRYYPAAQKYIEEVRHSEADKDETAWENFEWLYKEVLSKREPLPEEKIKEFFEDEVKRGKSDAGIPTRITDGGLSLPQSPHVPETLRHSEDFRTVYLRDQTFSLTSKQAEVVQVMYEHYQRGIHELSQDYILTKIDSTSNRLRDLFKSRPEAWRTLIKSCQKGMFRLNIFDFTTIHFFSSKW
jgi:hypothetical protein